MLRVATMVIRNDTHPPRPLFLREHREAKGVSAPAMARRLGIARESVYRLEREPKRVNPVKQVQWAAALDIEPEDLWRSPDRSSATP
jgi:transcriptional regulator with XRE-family HTH domain